VHKRRTDGKYEHQAYIAYTYLEICLPSFKLSKCINKDSQFQFCGNVDEQCPYRPMHIFTTTPELESTLFNADK